MHMWGGSKRWIDSCTKAFKSKNLVYRPWVNCTGIRTLSPGFRGSPLTHGYKTDPIMIHKRVTGKGHVLFLHVMIGSVLYPWVNCTGIRTLSPGFRGSPLTHGYKTDPIMIHKRVTGTCHVLFKRAPGLPRPAQPNTPCLKVPCAPK